MRDSPPRWLTAAIALPQQQALPAIGVQCLLTVVGLFVQQWRCLAAVYGMHANWRPT